MTGDYWKLIAVSGGRKEEEEETSHIIKDKSKKKNSGDEKYGVGNAVSDTMRTLCGDGRGQHLPW